MLPEEQQLQSLARLDVDCCRLNMRHVVCSRVG